MDDCDYFSFFSNICLIGYYSDGAESLMCVGVGYLIVNQIPFSCGWHKSSGTGENVGENTCRIRQLFGVRVFPSTFSRPHFRPCQIFILFSSDFCVWYISNIWYNFEVELIFHAELN